MSDCYTLGTVIYITVMRMPPKIEYFVPVKWLETRSEQEVMSEVGFFGNQNTVCKPTAPKWHHTVEKLKLYFKNWDIQV